MAIDYAELMKEARKRTLKIAKTDSCKFIENFVKIESKEEGELIPFKLWKEQKEALLSIDEHKATVVLKARQLGLSWLVISYAVKEMLARPGYVVLIFSQGRDEAEEMIRRAGKVIMPNLKGLEGEGGIKGYKPNTAELTIYHNDGRESVMTAFATTGKGGRGFTADLIIFDEWATHAFAAELFKAALPTINREGSGKFIGLSTMTRGTLFEDVVVHYKEKGFNRVFIPWYADPRRNAKWYEDTKKILGDGILQEYPATVEEALMIPGGAFFPEFDTNVHLRDAKSLDGCIYYISIDYGLDMLSIRWVSVDSKGRCRVYREFDKSDLIVSEAAREIKRYMPGEGKPISILAPPDMWNRETQSGRSRADIFRENGVLLTKSSNDIAAGCAALKELLYHDEKTEPRMTFERGCTARCVYDLSKIQKDKKRSDIYAKEPHELTHGVDALRYFAVWYIQSAPVVEKETSVAKHFKEMRRRKKRSW